MILALEGLDGSGKTEVGAVVAGILGADFESGIPADLGAPSAHFLSSYQAESRYLYYLAAITFRYEKLADLSRLVVVDRFLGSAHGLHVGVLTPLAERLRKIQFGCADLSVYLDVAEEERVRRLANRSRGLDRFEQRLLEDVLFRSRVADTMKLAPNTIVVDTTNISVQEVAKQVVAAWKTQHPKNEACDG